MRQVSSQSLALVWFAWCVAAVPLVAQEQPLQQGKTGDYTLEADGVDAQIYGEVLNYYGALTPQLAAKIRTGASETVVEKEGQGVSWEVYCPQSYDGKMPFGLIVYINSGDTGKIKGDWKPVLDKHRLIWIGANNAGNNHDTGWRHSLAVEAVAQLRQRYRLDPNRIYVSGNSGGGRVCSQVMVTHCQLFTGGFPHIGCNPYRTLVYDGNGLLPTKLQNLPRAALRAAATKNRFVFLTGSKDFNRKQTQAVAQSYQKDGFRHVSYLEVPGMAHSAPNAEWFEKGIVALDAPLRQAAAQQYELAKTAESRNQKDAALEGYMQAALYGGENDFVTDAKQKYLALQAEYDEQVRAVEAAIEAKNLTEANQLLADFRRTWSKFGLNDAKRLAIEIREARK